MKWLKKMFNRQGRKWGILVSLGLLCAVIFFLPTILTFSSVSELVLGKISQGSWSDISVGSCHAGWLQPLACQQVRVRLPHQGMTVSIDRLYSDRSVAALILAPRNLGTLTIDHPVFSLEKKAVSAEHNVREKDKYPASEEQKRTAAIKEKKELANSSSRPVWEGIRVNLSMKNGEILIPDLAPGKQKAAGRIALKAVLENGCINYDLECNTSGETKGTVQASGFFNLPVRKQAIMETLVSRTKLTVDKLDLAAFSQATSTLLPEILALPSYEGQVQGEWLITTAGVTDVAVKGKTDINSLSLRGGFLGEDQPGFHHIQLAVNGRKNEKEGVQIDHFSIDSEILSLEGRAQIQGRDNQAEAEGRIDLAQLYASFPHALHLKAGTTFSSGEVSFSTELSQAETVNTVKVQCRVDAVNGTLNDQPFLWDKPLVADATVSEQDGKLTFSAFELSSSFATLTGKGKLDNFSLHGTASLDKTTEAFQSFISLDKQPLGTLSFGISSTIESDGLYHIKGQVTSTDFSLRSGDRELVPANPMEAEVTFVAPDLKSYWKTPFVLHGSLAGWPGRITFNCDKVKMHDGGSGTCALDAALHLGPIAELLAGLGVLTGMEMDGTAVLQSMGQIDDGLIHLDRFEVDVPALTLEYEQLAFQDSISLVLAGEKAGQQKAVVVSPLQIVRNWQEYRMPTHGSGLIDLVHRSLDIQSFSIHSKLLHAKQTAVNISDWADPLSGLYGTILVHTDLQRLTDFCKKSGFLSDNIITSGQGELTGELRGKNGRLDASFDVAGKMVSLKKDDLFILDKQSLGLKVRLTHDTNTGILQVSALELNSPLLYGQARVSLQNSPAGKNVGAKGKIIPDLTALTPLIQQISAQPVTLQGEHAHRFSLLFPLREHAAKKNISLDLHYEGQIDQARYKNIELDKLTTILTLDKGKGRVALDGEVYGGQLTVVPEIDMTTGPLRCSLTQATQVLTDVKLSKPLTGFLAHIHPLFGVIGHPEGTIDMLTKEFSYNGSSPKDTTFTVVFDLREMYLRNDGLLQEILPLVQHEEKPLQLKESELTCEGKDGRITCSPVHLSVAASEMVLTGSLGFDGSLDYTLRVPVNRNLIGQEVAHTLGDATIDIPITGTVETPFFSRKKLRNRVSTILKQAGEHALDKKTQEYLPGLLEKLLGE
ncbi:MAG: hypothetical protein CSA32_01100 [Desulfobulbus propionicus]|nr:MAG: hypothetical protein CSA32_01100 [Desulfobulbus propionicus]